MTYTFNPETRQVHLDLSIDEFDLLRALRFAATTVISPLNPDSDYGRLVREIDYISSELTILRLRN